MAELTLKERLQPSLLDRLTDDEPNNKEESREKRVLSMQKLRTLVLRDISWLLNARSFESVENLSQYPEVAKSVLNYGIRDLSGITLTGTDLATIEASLKKTLQNFEPRIKSHSIKIQVSASTEKMNLQAMVFTIEADLWAQPLPIHLYIRSELDLETGSVGVRELGN